MLSLRGDDDRGRLRGVNATKRSLITCSRGDTAIADDEEEEEEESTIRPPKAE